MLIDTHCHLDADRFDADREQVLARSRTAGVRAIIIPAIDPGNFATVRALAHSFDGGAYALGIHPLFLPADESAGLRALEHAVKDALGDPRFVALGEIGLDFFVPESRDEAVRERQERMYTAQLDLAGQHGLPVLLHVRRSQDIVLKHLRRREAIGGIAHAFNGSFQQAEQFLEQGFALGMGGAMTFPRARQIRRLACRLPLEALVLETDAPDIPPAWLQGHRPRNEPSEVAGVARVLGELRDLPREAVWRTTADNAMRVLPRLRDFLHGG